MNRHLNTLVIIYRIFRFSKNLVQLLKYGFFYASTKSSAETSLNDILMTGPTIQDNIYSHLLRFRIYNYVLTGDIEKMYRQFKIRQKDRKFQGVLWKTDDFNIKTLELNTATFGMSSSPFLAIRAFRQIAVAAEIIKQDLYKNNRGRFENS